MKNVVIQSDHDYLLNAEHSDHSGSKLNRCNLGFMFLKRFNQLFLKRCLLTGSSWWSVLNGFRHVLLYSRRCRGRCHRNVSLQHRKGLRSLLLAWAAEVIVTATAACEQRSYYRLHIAFIAASFVRGYCSFVLDRCMDLHHRVRLRLRSNACLTQIEVGADSTFISCSKDWSTTTVTKNVWMLHLIVR